MKLILVYFFPQWTQLKTGKIQTMLMGKNSLQSEDQDYVSSTLEGWLLIAWFLVIWYLHPPLPCEYRFPHVKSGGSVLSG